MIHGSSFIDWKYLKNLTFNLKACKLIFQFGQKESFIFLIET